MMEGNLDAIPEIAVQDNPENNLRQSLTSYNLYQFDRETFFSSTCTLFQEISKIQLNSLLFFFFQNAIIFVQLISSWFYSFFPLVWSKSTNIGKFILGINCILQFSDTNNPDNIDLPAIVIPFFVNLAIDIFFFVLLILMKKRGLISHQIAIIASITFQFLLLIIYLPTFSGFASTFKFIVDKNPIAITFFILYVFIISFMAILFKLLSSLVSYPSNPTILFIATYNGSHTSNIIFFEGLKIIMVKVTELYDNWFFILSMVVHVILYSYQIYDLFSFPFVHFYCMPFFFGLYSGAIVSDILTTVSVFGPNLYLIRFIIPIGVFVVAWIISYFIFKTRYNGIGEILDPKLITELEKIRYYEELPINNIKQATIFIRVGFSKLIPSAIDGWLEIIIARQYHNFDLWLLAGNLVSFFPCNRKHLEECIDKLSVMHTSSTANKVLFLRLIQILQARDNCTSEFKDDKREEMRTITGNAINSIKTFWKDISEKNDRIPTSRIYSIAGIIDYAKWNWREILSLYPNDPYLFENYSCFLVECLGKFKTGLKWKFKSNYLESGYQDEIDPLFKSFLLSMPRAWNDHLVDYYGNLQNETSKKTSSFELMSTQAQLENDIDSGVFNREAEKVFRWPHLRFCLTKAVSHYFPSGLLLFRAFKYIAFLGWFAILITMTIYYSKSFNNIVTPFEQMEYLISIRSALAELRNIIFLNHANREGYLYTEEIYNTYIPEIHFDESLYKTRDYLDSYDSFEHWSQVVVDSLIQFYKTNDGLSDKEDVSYVFSEFLNEIIPSVTIRENFSEIIYQNISMKSAIINLLWNYHFFSLIESEEYDDFMNNTMIFETSYLHPHFSVSSDRVLTNFVSQASENSAKVEKSIVSFIFIQVFIPLLVLVPIIIVPLIIIHMNTLKIFKILKSIDSDSAKVASQKLSKISKFTVDYSYVNKIKSKKETIIVLIVFYVLFMIIPFILCIVTFFIVKSYYDYCMNLIYLARYGDQREAIMSEILSYSLMFCTSYYSFDPDANINYLNFLVEKTDIDTFIEFSVDYLDICNSIFYQGDKDNEGIYSLSKKIRDLHLNDRCSSDLTQADMHPFYECIGLERLISTFCLYVSSFYTFVERPILNDELFVNLVHLGSYDLYRGLNESRNYLIDLIYNSMGYTRTVTITLLVLSIVAITINIFIDFALERNLLQSLNAVLILILHLPSPTIAENPSLYKIFINKKSDDDKESNEEDDKDQLVDPKQIIFNTTQTPIMCIGDGFIIETINKAFRIAFDYSSEQLVGKKLTSFIENPLKNELGRHESSYHHGFASRHQILENDIVTENKTEVRSELRTEGNDSLSKYTNEEKGAIRMYEKMRNTTTTENIRSKYPIQCICGNDSIINTSVTVYPVHDTESSISNFILKIENNRQFKEVERKLEDAKSRYNSLLQQLIPQELDNYLKDKDLNVAFSAKCVTVVAVRALDPFDDLNESNDRFNDIMQSIENTAYNHPPFIKAKSLFHLLMFIGGLFSNRNEDENGEIIIDKKNNENENENLQNHIHSPTKNKHGHNQSPSKNRNGNHHSQHHSPSKSPTKTTNEGSQDQIQNENENQTQNSNINQFENNQNENEAQTQSPNKNQNENNRNQIQTPNKNENNRNQIQTPNKNQNGNFQNRIQSPINSNIQFENEEEDNWIINLNDNNNNNNNNDNNNLNNNNNDNNNLNNNNNNNNNHDKSQTSCEEDRIHANVAIDMAKEIRKTLNKILPAQIPDDQKTDSVSSFRIGKSKYAIAIMTGGPVICCLTGEKHKSFEIIGDIIDDAFELLAHAPPKSIIIHESTKNLLKENNIKDLEIGPDISNERTYML